MAEVIRNFTYKTRGRGRGVLGLPEIVPEGLRKPGGLAGLTGASAVGGGGRWRNRVAFMLLPPRVDSLEMGLLLVVSLLLVLAVLEMLALEEGRKGLAFLLSSSSQMVC